MNFDQQLSCRLPGELKDKLDEIHERHRIPTSELVRYLLETGLAQYAPRDRPGPLDTERLVLDVAEDAQEFALSKSHDQVTRTSAAA